MIALAVISIVFAAVFVIILFTPVRLKINTDNNQYQLYQRGTFKVCFLPELPAFRFSFFGYTFNAPKTAKTQSKKKPVKKKKTRTHFTPIEYVRLVKAMVQKVRLDKFIADIDTDDVVLNARLVPICMFLSGRNRSLSVNFNGRVCFQIDATVLLYKLLLVFLSFKLKHKRLWN